MDSWVTQVHLEKWLLDWYNCKYVWYEMLWLITVIAVHDANEGGGGRSGTVGGSSPRCFFWVLPKRSNPKPNQHRKDIIPQESLYVICYRN